MVFGEARLVSPRHVVRHEIRGREEARSEVREVRVPGQHRQLVVRGEEVFARWVDIVVTGGSEVKPGQRIQIELKTWTEATLRVKTPGRRT